MKQQSALIIDDNRWMRDALADTLGALGYRTTTAADGVEGIEKFACGDYDVVLTDLEMPRMDGRAVARHVREGQRGIGVVVISAAMVSGMAPPAWADDRVALLGKPVSLEDLTAAIDRVTAPAPRAA